MQRFFGTSLAHLCAGVVMVGLVGCDSGSGSSTGGGGHSHGAQSAGGHGHAHPDEPRVAQFTIWDAGFEVFAEHRLMVVDEDTRFITHLTDLKTFAPRVEGAITFVFTHPDSPEMRFKADQPVRDGIYEPIISLPEKGEWQMKLLIPTDDGVAEMSLPSVQVYADDHDVAHAPDPEELDGITLLKEQQWRIPFKTQPVTTRTLVERFLVPGMVMSSPGGFADVTAPVSGQIVRDQSGQLPSLGDRVEEGQLLCRIQPRFSEEGALLAEAEAAVETSRRSVEYSKTAFDRVQRLFDVGAKSERELQDAEQAHLKAQTDLRKAITIRSTYRKTDSGDAGNPGERFLLEVRSPISGTISAQQWATGGTVVEAGQPIYSVVNTSNVYVRGNLPEVQLSRVRSSLSATYSFPSEPGQTYPLTGENGRLVYKGEVIDPETRTIPLTYSLSNPDGILRIGQLIQLHVETDRSEDGFAIPESAIVEENTVPVAFVHLGGETFEKRILTLGFRDGNWVQVVSGVEEGDRIVTAGAMVVRLASSSSSIPAHGHAH